MKLPPQFTILQLNFHQIWTRCILDTACFTESRTFLLHSHIIACFKMHLINLRMAQHIRWRWRHFWEETRFLSTRQEVQSSPRSKPEWTESEDIWNIYRSSVCLLCFWSRLYCYEPPTSDTVKILKTMERMPPVAWSSLRCENLVPVIIELGRCCAWATCVCLSKKSFHLVHDWSSTLNLRLWKHLKNAFITVDHQQKRPLDFREIMFH